MTKLNDYDIVRYPLKVHISYSLGSFFDDFLATALSFMVFKFYETEVFLQVSFITVAIIIYGLYCAFSQRI